MPDSLEEETQKAMAILDADILSQPRCLSFSNEAQIHFDEWLVRHENDARFGAHPLY